MFFNKTGTHAAVLQAYEAYLKPYFLLPRQ